MENMTNTHQKERRVILKKPELLSPAGDLEKLKIAVKYGADAVFIGGKEFSLRARASNFTIEDIREGVEFAKQYGAKVYVTTNIIAHNDNIAHFEDYLIALEKAGVTAVITADPYLTTIAKKLVPNLEVHISTQQSVVNSEAVNYWAEEGASRVVLGRELTLDEIRTIKNKAKCEIEVFIHGGMCASYSGRCTLSNNMTDRDANRGGCAHSCRWNYEMFNQANEKISHDEVAYSFSSKDLMAVHHIPSLIEMGVDSLKIEGRMKSLHYIATVVGTYRKLIDDYCADPDNFEGFDTYLHEIAKAENRLTADGFLSGKPTDKEQLYNMRSEQPTQEFIAIVKAYDPETGLAEIEQRNYFTLGDQIEIFGPMFKHHYTTVTALYDENMHPLDVARHPRQKLFIPLPFKVEPDDMIRLKR